MGANNGNREIRWQDDVLMLGGTWTTAGTGGALEFVRQPSQPVQKNSGFKASTNAEAGGTLSFCAPRGFWYENIAGALDITYIMFDHIRRKVRKTHAGIDSS